MTNRKYTLEDWLLIIAAVIFFILILVFSNGCASIRQSVTEVDYSSGCRIQVKAINNERATSILKSIKFEDCSAGSSEGLESGKATPPE